MTEEGDADAPPLAEGEGDAVSPLDEEDGDEVSPLAKDEGAVVPPLAEGDGDAVSPLAVEEGGAVPPLDEDEGAVVSPPPPPLGDALADEDDDGSIVPTDTEEGAIVVILETTLGLLDDNVVSTVDGATLDIFDVVAEDGAAVLISDFSMVGIALGKPPPPTTELPPVGIILGLDVTGHNTVPSGIAWKN